MEEAEYDVEKMHADFIKRTNAQPGDKMIEALDDCMNESKLYNHVIYRHSSS